MILIVSRNRSIENSWHWVRNMVLREDGHRYRENNVVRILANLRSLSINALRLNGVWPIAERFAAMAHDTKGLFWLLESRKLASSKRTCRRP